MSMYHMSRVGRCLVLAGLLGGCAGPSYAPPSGMTAAEAQQQWSHCKQVALAAGGTATTVQPYRDMNMAAATTRQEPNQAVQERCLDARGWTSDERMPDGPSVKEQ